MCHVLLVKCSHIRIFLNCFWKIKTCISSRHMTTFTIQFVMHNSLRVRQCINTHLYSHSMKVSVRHKEAGRQKDKFYWRHCYGCCANASICHCLVLTVVPTTGFTAAASQIYNVGRGTKKRSGGPL